MKPNIIIPIMTVSYTHLDVYKRQLKDFDRQLAEMGYRINFDPNRKYWTIIGKGWQRPKRLYKLGEEYANDRIMGRISENSYAVKFQSFSEPQPQVKVYRVKGSLKNAKNCLLYTSWCPLIV